MLIKYKLRTYFTYNKYFFCREFITNSVNTILGYIITGLNTDLLNIAGVLPIMVYFLDIYWNRKNQQ